jgi:hypothetical protein
MSGDRLKTPLKEKKINLTLYLITLRDSWPKNHYPYLIMIENSNQQTKIIIYNSKTKYKNLFKQQQN